MRDKLRQETGNRARNKIINPVIDSVVHLAQQRETQQKSDSVDHLIYLLDTLVLPDSYRKQLKTIGLALADIDEDKDIDSCIDQLVHVIEEACKGKNTKATRIELKMDDPLAELLENLSFPGELGIQMISLRKRASEIEEEQDRLQLIQDLVQLLSRQNKNDEEVNSDMDIFPHLKETLLELFEWLSIPEEYSTRVESVKAQIARLQSDPDLSAVLRDTAIVINDLQAALQLELGDIQNFLAKVTARLEDVENCFRDMAYSESENLEETQQFNSNIEKNVRNIREGIADSEDVKEIKQTIESRLLFIEQSVAGFRQSTQSHQDLWEKRVTTLKKRIHNMKGETQKLHRRIQEEYKRAKTDALTGIPNRLAYDEKIKQEFARWQRNAQPFTVCVVDVDKFKGVNDSFGHKAGDKVLKTIAEVCAANIRKMDFIARYGGEEFVLLLPETALDQARVVAENLRREIEIRKFHYSKEPVVITISCGLAEFGKNDTAESVFNRADKALYTAKERGRNQVVDEKQI